MFDIISRPTVPTLLERYSLVDTVGHGTGSTVYKAVDLLTNQNVALKVYDLRLQRDLTFVAYFRRDAQQAQSFDNSCVLPLLSYGYVDERYFVTSEFMDNGNFSSYLAAHDVLSPPTAQIMDDVCTGLHYLHERNRLHSAIKPANILFSSDWRARLADIGPSHASHGTGMTITDAAFGAVPYFSPEQVAGGELTPASDLYSVGVVLYSATTGHLPFSAPNLLALAFQLLNDEPQRPSVHNPHISPALETIIMRCLAKKPDQRFASALELGKALSSSLVWEPVDGTQVEQDVPSEKKSILPKFMRRLGNMRF